MYRLVAWGESIDPAAADVNLAAIPDESINTFGDFIRVPAETRFLAGEHVHIEATAPSRARIESPSLRVFSNQDISLNTVSDASAFDGRWQMHPGSPREFLVNEDVELIITATGGLAADNWGAMLLADGPIQPMTGNIFTTRLTAAIAQAEFVWTNGVLTFLERLPVRDYDVVGISVQAASGTYARLIFPGTNMRPGTMVVASSATSSNLVFRMGNMGVMGRFNLNQPPQLEVLGGAAVAQVVYLDLIPV